MTTSECAPSAPARRTSSHPESGGEPATFLWSAVARRARFAPRSPLLIGANGESVTAADTLAMAEATASALVRHDIGPGARVAWQLPTGVDAVLLMLALARVGAVQAPVDADAAPLGCAAAVRDARADTLVVAGTGRDGPVSTPGSRGAAPRVLSFAELTDDGRAGRLPATVRDHRAATWIHRTAGVIGVPKGVLHSDLSLASASAGLASGDRVGRPDTDIGAVLLPVATAAGAVYLAAMIRAGVPVAPVDHRNPGLAVGVLRQLGITVAAGHPSTFDEFVVRQRALPRRGVLLPRLRLCKMLGEPRSARAVRDVERALGATAARDYGMCEAPVISASRPADSPAQLANTAGTPPMGTRVRIVEGGIEVPAQVSGAIEVHGPGVCLGYTDPVPEVGARTADGWFRTGDRGRLGRDGHLTVFGRGGLPHRGRGAAAIGGLSA